VQHRSCYNRSNKVQLSVVPVPDDLDSNEKKSIQKSDAGVQLERASSFVQTLLPQSGVWMFCPIIVALLQPADTSPTDNPQACMLVSTKTYFLQSSVTSALHTSQT